MPHVAYYVYELIDPRTGVVFYVGKGKGSRIDAHEIEARKGRLSRKCDWIREIEAEGLAVLKSKVKTFSDEQDAYDFEADLVDKYGLHSLANIIPGGGLARSGPTLFLDRIHTRAAAEIINRTKDGQITRVFVAGQPLDLLPIIEEYKRRVTTIIHRRGEQWVNAISERFGVEFIHVPA